jgi:hypothetical protein
MKLVCYDPHSRRPDIVSAMEMFPDIAFERPVTPQELEAAITDAEILVTSNRAYEDLQPRHFIALDPIHDIRARQSHCI